MVSDLDELIDRLVSRTSTDFEGDLDQLISMYRQHREKIDSGGRVQKDKPKVDTTAILQALVPQAEKPKLRRI